ncbi:MAG: TIGR00153 family protein [Magnetococcales bacterium]|nr:TIGR00153 family protein [Magnetococcales bacterium]
MENANPLMSIFRTSPFEVLISHASKVVQCANSLTALFAAMKADDSAAIVRIKDDMFRMVSEAEALRVNLHANLPKSLFLPVNRNVLLETMSFQDGIASAALEIVGLVSQRKMVVPDWMDEKLTVFVTSCLDTCEQVEALVREMNNLVEAGFKGRTAERVQEMIRVLGEMESESDRQGDAMARWLFENEEKMDPVSVMFWYQVIRWAGKVADRAEGVGQHISLMIAK